MNNTEFGMYQGYNVEKNMEMSSTSSSYEMKNEGTSCPPMQGIVCPPVYECPKERCVHRQFVHEVPQECPFM